MIAKLQKKNPGFKRFALCPASSQHLMNTLGVFNCLEKGHSPSGCSNCWTCTPRVCKDRQNRLQMLMLKEALFVKLSDSGGSLALKTERPVFCSSGFLKQS